MADVSNPFDLEDLHQALKVLRQGGVVLYPTDTVWGLGCDATNGSAVARIQAIKKRSDAKSMLVLLENPNLLSQYVAEIPEIAWDLIELADSPLTIVYPGGRNLASNLLAADGTIGIRITREPFVCSLIRGLRKPLVSTSANISGERAPESFQDITPAIRKSVDYIVRHRQGEIFKGKPSGIIRLGPGGLVEIIRK